MGQLSTNNGSSMTFEEWLDEIENYGSRQERLGEELPISDTLIQWLRAAYEVGYEQGQKDDTTN